MMARQVVGWRMMEAFRDLLSAVEGNLSIWQPSEYASFRVCNPLTRILIPSDGGLRSSRSRSQASINPHVRFPPFLPPRRTRAMMFSHGPQSNPITTV